MRKSIRPFRLAMILSFLVFVCVVYIVVLFDMQVVHGAHYANISENNRLVGRTIEATRGRIMDRYENDLVSNRSVNHIVLDWVALHNSPGNTNDTLLEMVALARSMGYTHTDTLAITNSPLQYYDPMNAAQTRHLNAYINQFQRGIRNMVRNMQAADIINLDNGEPAPTPEPLPEQLCVESVTAVQLVAFMRGRYNIHPEYTAEEVRTIAGIRYEISIRDIVGMGEYIFIEDVGVELISAFLERNFPGIVVQETSIRRYNTTVAAHILGQVGPLTAEDMELDLFQGYPLDALVGRDGFERDFETFLHGVNGRMVQTVTAEGVVIGENVSRESLPGAHVISTLDSGMQAVAEAALRSTIRQINAGRGTIDDSPYQSRGGAVVAIDPNNGEVLTIASTPGFSLENFSEQYAQLAADTAGNPMLNRATGGVYEPGSAFKMVTALAALYHGNIFEHSPIFCGGAFMEYADIGYIFRCMGTHGYIDLREAISVSCNVFFFQLAHWVGLDNMDDFAALFGLGELTGIGFNEASGQRSTRQNLRDLNVALRPNDPTYDRVFIGQVLQVGIGQGVSLFTPLQLANYTAMIATGGVRYQPRLLREIRSYDGREVIYRPEPEVVMDIRDMSEEMAGWFNAIQEGMHRASTHGTADRYLANFRVGGQLIDVASKTGTVELIGRDDRATGPFPHGVFVAYAPVENPEIAIAVVIEHGGSGSAVIPVALAILEYFFRNDVVDQRLPLENVMLR